MECRVGPGSYIGEYIRIANSDEMMHEQFMIFEYKIYYSIRHEIDHHRLYKGAKFSLWQGYFGNPEYFPMSTFERCFRFSRVDGMLSIVEEDGEIGGGLF
jgi:hypothetical protein